MSVPESKARSEDFLELVERAKRGRIKLYLGFAAGVGKTYRMLEEAHALKKRGVDIVVGFVETHGRKETQRRAAGRAASALDASVTSWPRLSRKVLSVARMFFSSSMIRMRTGESS